jgi:hypothetical protein
MNIELLCRKWKLAKTNKWTKAVKSGQDIAAVAGTSPGQNESIVWAPKELPLPGVPLVAHSCGRYGCVCAE